MTLDDTTALTLGCVLIAAAIPRCPRWPRMLDAAYMLLGAMMVVLAFTPT